jgi:hypothetical protein
MNKPYSPNLIASDLLYASGPLTGEPTKAAPTAGVAAQGHVPYLGWGAAWQNHFEYARDALGRWLSFRPLINFSACALWSSAYGTISSIVDGLDGGSRVITSDGSVFVRPDFQSIGASCAPDANWGTYIPFRECPSVRGGQILGLCSIAADLKFILTASVEDIDLPTPVSLAWSPSSYVDLFWREYTTGASDNGWWYRCGTRFGWITEDSEIGTIPAPASWASGNAGIFAGEGDLLVAIGGDLTDAVLYCWTKVGSASWVNRPDISATLGIPRSLVWDPVSALWVLAIEDGRIYTISQADLLGNQYWTQRCAVQFPGISTGHTAKILGGGTVVYSLNISATRSSIFITEDFGAHWQSFLLESAGLSIQGNRYLYTWFPVSSGYRIMRAGPVDTYVFDAAI